MPKFETYLVYKPFNMLSQFTKEQESDISLADLPTKFQKDIYPIGRLDKDSEGLLLLSNDKSMVEKILNPVSKSAKTYLVQVENIPTEKALDDLRKGVAISINGVPYFTQKAEIELLTEEPTVPERNPPIRFRINVPTSWIKITIIEGKNRQIRKMTAAVGFPTLRLIRSKIGDWEIGGMKSGEVKRVK
jgi:23S rRNA pseudouridine2457 synthase